MPARKSSATSQGRSGSPTSDRDPGPAASPGAPNSGTAAQPATDAKPATAAKPKTEGATATPEPQAAGGAGADAARSAADSLMTVAEQVSNRVTRQLDLVMLTRERIQETLDEAAERGRVTRSDANLLVSELVKRGRQQTDELIRDVEQLLERGRDQLESAGRLARRAEPVDRLVRGADRARRTVGVGPAFPILAYDELTAAEVAERLGALDAPELRAVRAYELRHANRKTVLAAITRALG